MGCSIRCLGIHGFCVLGSPGCPVDTEGLMLGTQSYVQIFGCVLLKPFVNIQF